MFLLNHQLIQDYVESNSNILDIWDFEIEYLQHTFYYFRLGSEGQINGNPFKLGEGPGINLLTIEHNDFAIIKSHETFILSDKVFAIFGQPSDLIKKGAQLLHSPFVDPKFKGKLELGIKNISNKPIILEYKKQIIGKISFFDISDTYPIVVNPHSQIAKKYDERKPRKGDDETN
jgi:deoxycytidine triphosphate deaminase